MDKENEVNVIRGTLLAAGMAGFIYCVDALLYHYGFINAEDTNVSITALNLAVFTFLCYDVPRENSQVMGLIMLSLQGLSMLRKKE